MEYSCHCDTKRKICKKRKWDENADPDWTKIFFGEIDLRHDHIYKKEQ